MLDAASGWVQNHCFQDDFGVEYTLATVKIKPRISTGSVVELVHHAQSTPYIGLWDSVAMHKVVPEDHLLQMLHQFFIMHTNVSIYASTLETGLSFIAIVYISHEILQRPGWVLGPTIASSIRWAHRLRWAIPIASGPHLTEILTSHKSLWFSSTNTCRSVVQCG